MENKQLRLVFKALEAISKWGMITSISFNSL